MRVWQPLPIAIDQALIYHRFFLLGVETYLPHLRDEIRKTPHGTTGQVIMNQDDVSESGTLR
jgi:hypothetical protein